VARRELRQAQGEGKYRGRKPTARAKADKVVRLAGSGLSREQIAKELGIGVASVYRVLASARL
jgi:DNA invertase Pin-like site-specific DNA recombinase